MQFRRIRLQMRRLFIPENLSRPIAQHDFIMRLCPERWQRESLDRFDFRFWQWGHKIDGGHVAQLRQHADRHRDDAMPTAVFREFARLAVHARDDDFVLQPIVDLLDDRVVGHRQIGDEQVDVVRESIRDELVLVVADHFRGDARRVLGHDLDAQIDHVDPVRYVLRGERFDFEDARVLLGGDGDVVQDVQ